MSEVTPRGVRNNNPGNIDYDCRVPWQGQLGRESVDKGETPRFAVFDTAQNGIRAMAKILLAYQAYHHLYTLADMCGRWAPLGDGNYPAAYAEAVCASINKTGGVNGSRVLTITTPISLHDPALLAATLKGFIKVECAGYEYPDDTVAAAVEAAQPGSM